MNEIIKKALKEIARVVAAALLAGLGLEASGCVYYGSPNPVWSDCAPAMANK